LQLVYQIANLLTMSEQNNSKINQLLASLGEGTVVSARWLASHGYSTSLVARYVRSGWLKAPARGVYAPASGEPTWDGVLHSLQQRDGVRLHAGGRFALAWHGHEHYLRLGAAPVVTLYGPDRLPGWAKNLAMEQSLAYCGRGPFDVELLDYDATTSEAQLHDMGLARQANTNSVRTVVMASAERAMLELCDARPGAALVYEADAVMQGLAGLRPDLVGRLLQQCRSVKAKRLFLALAERHGHAWLSRVALDGVDLGHGKRVLVPGGRLDTKYLVTLPADLGEQLG
jgi:hypothetical protein